MFKAYPATWIDLKVSEAASILIRSLNTPASRGRATLPEFERAYAEFVGTKEAVAFTSCRSAIYYSLMALGFGKNDEVILPAYTFWADAAVVVLAGLRPVFVDVDFRTHNIDPSRIEAAVTPRTRAIMPVHLNGLAADMDAVMSVARRHRLRVIEDCARACGGRCKGRRVGSFDIGTFSFGYGKTFYAFGGGMATSNDAAFIKRLRRLKENFSVVSAAALYSSIVKGCILKFLNGPALYNLTLFPMAYRYRIKNDERFAPLFRIKKPPYETEPAGFRQDMYNLQATLGSKQLKRIDRTNEERAKNLKFLNRRLSGIAGLGLPPEEDHTGVHYAVYTDKKEALQRFLLDARIDAQDESAEDVTAMERFKDYRKGTFPNAKTLSGSVIFIPTQPSLSEKELLYMAGKVEEFFKG